MHQHLILFVCTNQFLISSYCFISNRLVGHKSFFHWRYSFYEYLLGNNTFETYTVYNYLLHLNKPKLLTPKKVDLRKYLYLLVVFFITICLIFILLHWSLTLIKMGFLRVFFSQGDGRGWVGAIWLPLYIVRRTYLISR